MYLITVAVSRVDRDSRYSRDDYPRVVYILEYLKSLVIFQDWWAKDGHKLLNPPYPRNKVKIAIALLMLFNVKIQFKNIYELKKLSLKILTTDVRSEKVKKLKLKNIFTINGGYIQGIMWSC